MKKSLSFYLLLLLSLCVCANTETRGNQPTCDMICIPAGSFTMGDNFNEGDSDELPLHKVTLNSFHISKYEVTNQQYCNFLNAALGKTIYISGGVVYGTENKLPYCAIRTWESNSQVQYSDGKFTPTIKAKKNMANYPMIEITWYGAAAYCNWQSQKNNRQKCYDTVTWNCDFSKKGFRLPTEAEWEYAARGKLSGKRFPWGNEISHSNANYYSCNSYDYDISPTRDWNHTAVDWIFPYTLPVGSFPANGFGLHDISGNVWHWCNDWYSKDTYESDQVNNPTGPASGNYRAVRGGGWSNLAIDCRIASRFKSYPCNRFVNYGFRVVEKK